MKESGRYIIGILFLFIAIALIVVLFNLVAGLFDADEPESSGREKPAVDLSRVPERGQAVQYTIIGPTVALEKHHRIRITIDRGSRTVEVLQGYDSQVVKSRRLSNTQEAYEAFIAALNGAGFASTVDKKGRGDKTQSCPLGRKYSYEVAPGTSEGFSSWSTSCGDKQGTFAGNDSLVRSLFRKQIPDYNEYTSDVRLG